MIIALFGPDGSGKTTQAELLASDFAKAGYRTVLVRMRAHHMIMYFLIEIFKVLGMIPSTHSPAVLEKNLKKEFSKSMGLFIALEAMSACVWPLIRVMPHVLLGKVVIAERYVPDFLATVEYLIGKPLPRESFIFRLMSTFMRDAVPVYLYADAETLIMRKMGEELSTNYLESMMGNYENLAAFFAATIIDTNENTTAGTHEKILEAVRAACGIMSFQKR